LASLILAIMVVPIIASLTIEILSRTPVSLKEGMISLGATKWETVKHVGLPFARLGILAAVMLGLGRALGETMAITMVIGNSYMWPFANPSIFAPATTITSKIASEFYEATSAIYVGSLIELSLILLVITLATNALFRYVINKTNRGLSANEVGLAQECGSAHNIAFPCNNHHSDSSAVVDHWLRYCHGASAINLEFLTDTPAPYGESGGGIANAILGTLIINAMASLFGIPVGMLTGMYLSEYANSGKFSSVIRASVESFSGVPSIIFGIFAFTLIVTTVQHYTAMAAAFASGIDDGPYCRKGDGGVDACGLG